VTETIVSRASDSGRGRAGMVARAQQDNVWERQQAANKLRSLLHEYYPTFLATFEDLASSDARATLAVAPTPAAAKKLRRASLRAALVRGGRQRNIDYQVDRILAGLRGEQFTQLPLVEQAMGRQVLAHLRALNTAVANIADLEQAPGEAFAQHPDAAIITSFPGLGTVLGDRILGEIGDDRTRFADAKALKAFAGTAPVTRASGLKRSVTMRIVRNRRLCHAGYLWALPLLTRSPRARARPAARTGQAAQSSRGVSPVSCGRRPPQRRDPRRHCRRPHRRRLPQRPAGRGSSFLPGRRRPWIQPLLRGDRAGSARRRQRLRVHGAHTPGQGFPSC
jgi:hypothetical protein